MKIRSSFFYSAFLVSSLPWLSFPQEENRGKTVADSVEFLSSEEYDKEAQVRISSFTLPEDITASLFADSSQTQNPSAICFDGKGRLYIAEIHRWRAGVQDIRNEQQILLDDINNETSEDRYEMYERDQLTRPLSFYTEFTDQIVIVEDSNNDGRADVSSIFADDFNDVLDGPGIGLIAGMDNSIYYTNIPHLWKLNDTDKDGTADERESLQDGFGVRMSISGHDMHGLVWGPDGRLYWSIGDRGYSFTTKEGRYLHNPYEGAVFRCDPDGSNLEEVHTGLRNPQELAFDAYGNLFTCDNDADQWDKGRLVYIIEGGDSGWNHGHQVLLNFRDQLELRTPTYQHPDHAKLPMNPWMTESLWEPQHDRRPAFSLPPVDIVSWGPSGMVYNYGVTAMPDRYANHFWICNFGGAKGDLEAFSVKEEGAGFALDQHEIFMVGLGNTDVEFGPDGKMYLSCFNNNGWYKQDLGNIYTLADEKKLADEAIKQTEKLLLTDFAAAVESELDAALGHNDLRVRQRAQFELAKRGARDVFLAAAEQSENRFKRLHGIWGLGQISRTDESVLESLAPYLSDSDSEVRAQTAKIFSDSRTEMAGEALLPLLDDSSARVKAFAAIGVGKCGNVPALPKLLEILAANDNKDVFLRHACVQGMWYLNEREKILKEINHESAGVRMGVLLTLRKLDDPRVKYFLNDPDPSIVEEAIRAINDKNLVTALPDLAKKIDDYSALSEGVTMPETHRDWILQTRLINANFRAGQPENATRLLQYAAQTKLPLLLREQALLALAEWKEPTPVDPTTGAYRPIKAGSRVDITSAVESGLSSVFDTAEGNLVSLATQIALEYGVEAPVELLTEQILDEKSETEARIGSLKGLAKQDAPALEALWGKLLTSNSDNLRAAAVGELLQIDKERGISEALKLANSDKVRLRQHGYRILGPVEDEKVAALFSGRLASIAKEKSGSILDLVESAKQQKNESVADKIAEYEASFDPADPMAAFHATLHGGNAAKGKEIFMTHAAGQCAKCHKVDGDGGVAGPDLTGIGAEKDRKYLLEALVAPSAVVVPGYGMTMVSLKNGESVGGAFLSENETSLTLKVSDPDDSSKQIERVIPLDEIATRQPPVSAMPPMGYLLSKSEVRDLVSFLASLQKKGGKKGH